MDTTRPISLLVCALGGEGGGVLTEWLVETARIAGYPAQATSIPGVAQRTGATTYYLEVFPVPTAQLGGRKPVFSLSPVPGALDALVSSELLETARQIGNGMASPDRTLVVSSTARLLTTHERMQMADGRADADTLLKLVQTFSREHHAFDMNAMAKECGTVVSSVLLGAIAGSGLLPFERRCYEEAVRGGVPHEKANASAQASLRGFGKAYELVSERKKQAAFVSQVMKADALDSRLRGDDDSVVPVIPAQAGIQGFPEPAREFATLGYARLLDYQGRAYADLYLQRLQQVHQAERDADPQGTHAFAITREMARWLALWMAFDDIVRVADLKSRASRWTRVNEEVRTTGADLLKVYDHFKPGAPEFAALLPAGLAAKVLSWDRRRVAAGREPWALPLKIGTHTALGMLALRALAAMRRLRPLGSRYATEQQMMVRWLGGVVQGTRRGWGLGHEIAQCGRLIKGYGSTNERGKENLLHVLDHLATLPDTANATRAIADARTAALADDAGQALDATLVRHGAPAREPKAVPIRFVRKPARQAA